MAREYHFRNLILWQRAQELAHEVIKLTRRLPQSWANAVIARQIIASATSIGANIAEGYGRFTIGAHRNHLAIARGSAAETDSWVDLLTREELLSADESRRLQERCDLLAGMLTNKIKALNAVQSEGEDDSVRERAERYQVEPGDTPRFPYAAEDYRSTS